MKPTNKIKQVLLQTFFNVIRLSRKNLLYVLLDIRRDSFLFSKKKTPYTDIGKLVRMSLHAKPNKDLIFKLTFNIFQRK